MKIFAGIAVGLIVVNIIYVLLPESSYNKYMKMLVGILLLVFIAGKIPEANILSVLSESENIYVDTPFYKEDYQETLKQQLEQEIDKRIKYELYKNFNKQIEVKSRVENGEITEICFVSVPEIDEKEIINFLSNTYKLDKERIRGVFDIN